MWAHTTIDLGLPPRTPGTFPGASGGPAIRGCRRGLILDLDDTLYPRERFVRSGLAAVATEVGRRHGIEVDAAYAVMTRALATTGNGTEFQALCRRFGLPASTIPTLIDVFRDHTPSLFLAPDVAAALRRLRAEGWALVVLTNGLPSVQFRKVAALGLSALVDEVIYAEEHTSGGKPSAHAFHAALRSIDLTAGQCICVGDDIERDIRGARALGIGTVRIARPGVALQGEDADIVIESMRQLPDAALLLLGTATAHVA